jgi:hypothetical protein
MPSYWPLARQMVGALRGEWWERPQGPTLAAYSFERHAEASRYAARRRPARFTPCEICRSLL